MRWRLFAVLVSLALLPREVIADFSTPGFPRVPHDFVFEVETDFPGYRFWLVSSRGVEPLDLTSEHPVRVDDEGRQGPGRLAWVVVTPVGLVEEMGMTKFQETVWPPKGDDEHPARIAGMLRSEEPIDFVASVPFWDSRERVIDRYRVEFVPGQHVRLVWLEQNKGSEWSKGAWIAGGVLVPCATIWGGWWIMRRVLRRKVSKVA